MTRHHKLWISVAGAIAGVAILSAAAFGQGRHARYIHARSDLRAAQILLRIHDEPNVMRHVNAVHAEVEAAIGEIDRAAVMDRRDFEDRPRIDTNLDRPGRFRKVMALLASARRDIREEEDNPRAIGWRDAAFRHIDAAMEQMRRAARELRIDRLEGN
jgi:hypothetical protein